MDTTQLCLQAKLDVIFRLHALPRVLLHTRHTLLEINRIIRSGLFQVLSTQRTM